ncbi:MAG: hypothetical protein HYU66_12620, partial [Armatimonadetes bacterium]|nr:hypothetical protein [Armatimonadota bacterium]
GRAPSLVEGIAATVTLPAGGTARAWALDERGQRGAEVPVKVDGATATIAIGARFKTLWYEIEVP